MSMSFQLRRGTWHDWMARNPRLREGEMGYEIGSGRYKVGDGFRNWVDLPYFANEEAVRAYIDVKIDELSGSVTGVTQNELDDHVNSVAPHPNWEDGADLSLLYENAKV